MEIVLLELWSSYSAHLLLRHRCSHNRNRRAGLFERETATPGDAPSLARADKFSPSLPAPAADRTDSPPARRISQSTARANAVLRRRVALRRIRSKFPGVAAPRSMQFRPRWCRVAVARPFAAVNWAARAETYHTSIGNNRWVTPSSTHSTCLRVEAAPVRSPWTQKKISGFSNATPSASHNCLSTAPTTSCS